MICSVNSDRGCARHARTARSGRDGNGCDVRPYGERVRVTMVSENGQTFGHTRRLLLDHEHGFRPQRLLSRAQGEGSSLRRPLPDRGAVDGCLLPPNLSGTNSSPRELRVLSDRGGRVRGRFQTVLALSAGDQSGSSSLERDGRHCPSCASPDRRRGSGGD